MTSTVIGGTYSGRTAAVDGTSYAMGTAFSLTSAGVSGGGVKVVGLRYWPPAGGYVAVSSGDKKPRAWVDQAGSDSLSAKLNQIASADLVAGAGASGPIDVMFPNPVVVDRAHVAGSTVQGNLQSHVTLAVPIGGPNGYFAIAHFFDSDVISADGLVMAGMSTQWANGRFSSSNPRAYPDTAFNAAFYGIDALYVPLNSSLLIPTNLFTITEQSFENVDGATLPTFFGYQGTVLDNPADPPSGVTASLVVSPDFAWDGTSSLKFMPISGLNGGVYHEIYGLTAGTTYKFRVKAYTEAGGASSNAGHAVCGMQWYNASGVNISNSFSVATNCKGAFTTVSLDAVAPAGTVAARIVLGHEVGFTNGIPWYYDRLFFGTDASGWVLTPVSGVVAPFLAGVTSSASGTVVNATPVTGTVAVTLQGTTAAATGQETISGSVSQQLQHAVTTALGRETMAGSGAAVLGNVTSAATGVVVPGVSGTAAVTLQSVHAAAAGAVDNSAVAAVVGLWNGTAFVPCLVMTWNGTAFVNGVETRVWDGDTFEQALAPVDSGP